MSNVLTMSWSSQSSESCTYTINDVKHGDTPTFSPSQLSSTQPVTVKAAQSNNLSPGPEGKYTWSSQDLTKSVECNYHFPAGSKGQLIQITLAPSKGFEISFDGVNWTSDKREQSWTSTTTTFTAKLYLRDTPTT